MSLKQLNYQQDVSNDLIKNIVDSSQNIYIFGNGGAGRWAWNVLASFEVDVKAFVDSDVKKKTMNHGFHTISISEAENVLKKTDLLIIGAVDIHEILTIKNQTKLHDIPWVSLGSFAKIVLNMKNVQPPCEFEKYALDVVLDCHQRLLDPDDNFLRSVDIVITEKCTLRCRDCANLMQYYKKPKDGGVEEISAAVEWLLKNTDGVYEFRLIGGEPFMNKKIYEIVEVLLKHENYTKLVIYTNGMIPIKEKYKELFLDEKVVFSITDYGDLAKNTTNFVKQVSEWGCIYRVHPPEHWTDSGRIKKQNRSELENQKTFDECCGKNLWTLSDKGFGRCPFSLNAAHLGAVDFKNDSVVSVGDTQKLKKYIANENYLSLCELCNGRSFSSPEITPAIQAKAPLDMEL